MGTVFSSLAAPFKLVKSLVTVLKTLEADFSAVAKRAKAPPPLPHAAPTQPFWLLDPPHPELVDIQSQELPHEAEVVIIGSGITGAAVARSLLQSAQSQRQKLPGEHDEHDEAVPRKGLPRVVVLEARQLCSGATGRNGGHIKATAYETVGRLLKQGAITGERAAELVRFQLRHLPVLTGLCAAEGIGAAECREVDTVDLFVDNEEGLRTTLEEVEALRKWVPEFEVRTWTADEACEKFKVNHHVVGAISYKAGALWPYRLVSSVWKNLLKEFPDSLSIETNTPATSISVLGGTNASAPPPPGALQPDEYFPYLVTTPRGAIRARHVVHATNAYTGHLVPGLHGKTTGVLAHMSAQRPGIDFPRTCGSRSWGFVYAGQAFDYVTQRPGTTEAPGELMIGGGFTCAPKQGADMVGVYDDSRLDALTVAHLEGIMPAVFRPRWGADEAGGGPRVKDVWSGVIAFTADLLPLVGRLDEQTTGRRVPTRKGEERKTSSGSSVGEPNPGEWISAGYCGEGMIWAWLSGTAVGLMLSGCENVSLPAAPGRPEGRLADWFPAELRPTRERIARMDIMDLADNVM
ncbi:hypothetical protein MAPG_10059 [Magnaporthiopsis poae ATCC 64411]|uniref:FAD dependent oxidoreductase domain-containing protein n=1 Tax=Magnaporthiopsis poae (strain ATCC 64411 / 73-15) TaxID=644358 RepID=A0A0C4EBK7_MAGP6|nr:hypothetical protein MAPG_10059 [Magnaporthiopsis poae ATCC 64411]